VKACPAYGVLPLLAAILMVTIACEASYPMAPTLGGESLEVQYRSTTGPVRVGSSAAFTPYLVRTDGAWLDVRHSVTWSSSNPAVARVDWDTVVAVSPGTANVIATYEGLSGSVEVEVVPNQPQPVPPLLIVPAAPDVLGETLSAQAWFTGQNVTTSATWSSSDPPVATVDARGVVIARAPGTVRISASYQGVVAWYVFSVPPGR
jgi:uncharacterized protein YjdB